MARIVRSSLTFAAALLALAGCATRPIEAPVSIAAAPPPPPIPTLPPGIPDKVVVPAVDADGTYLTINHGLDSAETAWHVRSALNVAALGCRGAREAEIIAAYNAMLREQRGALAAALKATETHWKAERGPAWQSEHDRHMTRVYNFFAQPAAQQRFCEVAAAVLAEAQGVPAAGFAAFTAAALPRLEAPFTDVYRAFDGYRRDLAAWQARYGSGAGTALAAAETPAAPQLAYEGLGDLIRWDAKDRSPLRTALR